MNRAFGMPPFLRDERQYDASPHWRDGRFQNTMPRYRSPVRDKLRHYLRYFLTYNARRPGAPIPVVPLVTRDFTHQAPMRATWLGHAMILLELDGVRLLTDPVFSSNAGPWRYTGPRRFFDPPMSLDALPYLDSVLITHDHYDHLDYQTIRVLAQRLVRFIVPLGVQDHLIYWGVDPKLITVLDWWQRTHVGEVEITATPTRHSSGRALNLGDRNKTLWCGWALRGRKHRLFVAGDGGYCKNFREIGERLGPFDLAWIEIGAYNRHWMDAHMGPEQAVRVAQDVGARVFWPTHWATFDLAMHGWVDPIERALIAAKELNVRVVVPKAGEIVTSHDLDHPSRLEVSPWWPRELRWQTAAEDPIVSSGFGGEGEMLAPDALVANGN